MGQVKKMRLVKYILINDLDIIIYLDLYIVLVVSFFGILLAT